MYWLKSNDQADPPLPEKSDEARKIAEYNKEKENACAPSLKRLLSSSIQFEMREKFARYRS